MTIFQAFVYGIVQGATEFLPVSSTAHLVLVPFFTGWQDPGAMFDIALHFGTAVAVIAFFYKEWIVLLRSAFTKPASDSGRLFWFIVLACIPGGIAGVLLDKYMGSFRDPMLIGIMLMVMGAFLYYADRFGKKEIDINNLGIKRSIIVGISQIFAIIPGVSRSGVTIASGRALGIKREDIAKFTFLLSGPFILADAIFHTMDLREVAIDIFPLIIAALTAGITGALCIKFLLGFINKKGFGIFAGYRIILGFIAIIFSLLRF
jgi:undecaprenyl-diphosphatase